MPRNPLKPRAKLKVGQRYRGYKVLKVFEDGSAKLSGGASVDAETGKVKVRMPRKKKFPNTRFFGAVEDKVEGTMNSLMEMDMRGELADSPYEKGVVRVNNRWRGSKKNSA